MLSEFAVAAASAGNIVDAVADNLAYYDPVVAVLNVY